MARQEASTQRNTPSKARSPYAKAVAAAQQRHDDDGRPNAASRAQHYY
jgi:hypothetical protein